MAGKVKLLVDKAGRMNEYWQDYTRRTWDHPELEWPEPEYRERRRILLATITGMEGELGKRGQTMEHYGWTLAWDCQWHRIGEPTPPLRSGRSLMDTHEEEIEGSAGEEPEQMSLVDVAGTNPAQLNPWA